MILTAVFAFFSLASFASCSSNIDISACQDLNLTSAYYTLTQNVESPAGACFNVTASNVTLDCQNFNINFSTEESGGIAMNITGQNGAVVKNCFLNGTNSSVGSPTAIYLSASNNSRFYNNTIAINGTGGYGVYLDGGSNNNAIISNNIYDCYFGLYFDSDYNNTIDSNTINSSVSGAFGTYLQTSVNDTFKNNVLYMADSSYGFWLQVNSAYNTFRNNTINGTGGDYGIGLDTSSNNVFEDNTLQLGDSSVGVYLGSSTYNTLNNNPMTLTDSSIGVHAESTSDNNNIENTVITLAGANGNGIELFGSSNSTISNCVVKGAAVNGYGLFADRDSYTNSFTGITVENLTYGVYEAGRSGCRCTIGIPPITRLFTDTENTFNNITMNNDTYGFYEYNPPAPACGRPPLFCRCPMCGWGPYTEYVQKNTLSSSTITNAFDAVLIYGGSYSTIYNNVITNASNNGISLNGTNQAVSENYVLGNTVNKAANCVLLTGVSGGGVVSNAVYSNMLSSCDYGLTLDDAQDNVFADNTITGTTTTDVYAPTVSGNVYTNTLLNTAFNKSSVVLNNGGITVQWYLGVRTTDRSGNGVENAEVNATDANGTQLFSLTTDSNGYVTTQNATEFYQDSTGTYETYTPYSVTAQKDLATASATPVMDQSTNLVLVLNVNPPVISNVRTTDVTQNTLTIAWDTDEAANETLEYGIDANYGTNHTNNAFATTHSVLITGLAKTTAYHFKIYACDAVPNCGNSSDYTFSTLIEGTGYGGGAGGGALPSASPTIAPTEAPSAGEEGAAPPGAPQAPGAGAGPAGVTPQASEAPSVEAPSPSATPQPTGAGVNAPLAVVLTLALAGAAYFVATQGGFLKKK